MATKDSRFAQIYRQELAKNKGFMGAFASTGGARAKEMFDLRRYLLPESGVTGAISQRVFGKSYRYGAGRESIRTAGPTSSMSEKVVSEKLTRVDINTKISAKNSVVLPAMARDMNLMRLNMQKMVTLSGGKASMKSDMFFKRAAEREDLYESQFRKSAGLVTPTRENSVEKSGGFLSGLMSFLKTPLLSMLQGVFGNIASILVKGGLLLYLTNKLGEFMSQLVTDKEFREKFFNSVNSIMQSIFGEDVWRNLAIGIGTVVGALVSFNVVLGLATSALYALVNAAGRGVLGGPSVPDIPGVPDRNRTGTPPNRPSPQAPSGNARLASIRAIAGRLGIAGLAIGSLDMLGDVLQPISERERGAKAEAGLANPAQAMAAARRGQLNAQSGSTSNSPASVAPSRVDSGRDRGTSPTRVNGISENGIKFIAEKESFVGKAHWDNSQYSIGYGTRTDDPEEIAGRKTVTKEEAMRRLKEHVEKKIRPTLDPLAQKYGWNQSQYDAMASFAYNLGAGALTQVTAGGTRTNEQISSAMLQYNKERKGGSPVVSDGLTIRRRQEQTLFASNEPSTPITSPVDSRFRTASVPSPVSSVPNRPLTTNTPENTLISGVTDMMASVFSAMGDMTRSVQQIASAPTARSSEQSTPIPSPYDSQLFESLLMHHSSLGSSISGS